MAKANPSKIALVVGTPGYVKKEALADAAINPGYLVKRTATGVALQTIAVINTLVPSLVALENQLIGNSITDAYASGDVCHYAAFQKGDIVYLKVAAGATAIPAGGPVESAGDGTVKTTAAIAPFGYAVEAVDNSGGGAEVFIKVEVL